MIRRAIVLSIAAFTLVAAAPDEAAAKFRKADHPFMLWNKADLAAIRKRVATQPWAKEALAGLAADRKGLGRQLGELLRYALTGDGQLEAAERKQLLRVLKSPIPRGGAQWLTVLRYDLLYDKLTAEQRAEFEKMARIYIENGVLNNAVFDPKIFNDEANYAHNVNDAFAIVGYYAFRRPILINRQVTPGYATGWSRSIQSHCGVTVDGAEPKFTDATDIRHAFTGAVKFAAARSDAVYPGVGLTRSLFLTREYLLDVTRLAGRTQKLTPHEHTWIAHALGRLRPSNRGGWRKARLPEKLHALEQMRAFDTGGEGWSVIADQVCVLDDASKARLPRSWYGRKVGVRLSMLGGPPATVYAGRTPLPLARVREGKTRKVLERPSEVGGVTMLVSKKAPDATFAALWEPFEAGEATPTLFRPIAQKPEGLAVSIRGPSGSTVNDRAMLRLAGEADEPLTLEGGGESFTFADHTHVRIAKDKVNVSCGSLTAMKLRVGEARPRLVINGRPAKVRFDGAFMLYGAVR